MFTTRNLLMLVGRDALIAGFSVLVAIGSIYFFSRQIEASTRSITKNRATAAELEKRTILLNALKNDTETIGNGDTAIERAYPSADNILEFISVIEDLGFRNGMMQSFHFETPIISDRSAPFPLATVRYTNTLSGSTASFLNYLKEFEGLPYLTKINNLTLTAQRKEVGIREALTASYSATLYTKQAQ